MTDATMDEQVDAAQVKPDCQPASKPETVSDADVLAVVSGLENVRCDLFSMSRPAVSAIQGKAIHLIELLCADLTQARATVERQSGELRQLNDRLSVRQEYADSDAAYIAHLEADLASIGQIPPGEAE